MVATRASSIESSAPARPNPRNLCVADVMTTRVHTCSVYDTLEQAARVMREHDVGAVPVLDEHGHAIAMVTDRDICMTVLACRRLLGQISVMTAASRRMFAVETRDSLDRVHNLMCKHHVRRMPVVDGCGRLIGIVSTTDLIRASRSCGQPGLGDA